MLEDWKTGYKRALLTVLMRRAYVFSAENYYGLWYDNEQTGYLHVHSQVCSPDLVKTAIPVETEWDEFRGTFYEGDETVHGVDAWITCACGQYRGIHVRMTSTYSDLVTSVLRED